MNLRKLKQAEEAFFDRYPGGFNNPEMIVIRKVHKLDKMIELSQNSFEKANFKLPDLIVQNMVKIISRSSLISVFEKPRFRDFAHSLPNEEIRILAGGLGELLHGNQRSGFETMLNTLRKDKLAKWPLMSVCQAYFRPEVEVFLKPTTVKDIIQTFELENLHYHPAPTWTFYEQYRAAINEMKNRVDPSLARYNISFSGFLMRSMQGNYL